ncbi:type III secretion system translocon subunit SctE [Endozoicomonas lisbonensis]
MGGINTSSVGNADQTKLAGLVSAETEVQEAEKPVDRGFSGQNSYSRTEGDQKDAAPASQIPKPNLDKPSDKGESEKATTEALKTYEKDESAPLAETLGKSVEQFQKKPLANQISTLQGKKAELQKMGFNEAQIDGMTALADPDDPDNSLSSMHSAPARMKDLFAANGQPKLNKLYNAFEDVLTRFSAIREIPDDLKKGIQEDVTKLTQSVLNSKDLLDIDSATTMITKLQSQLQNERIKFDEQTIRLGQMNRNEASDKRISQITEAIEKANKARQSSFFGKIFGYIAMAVMAVAAVAMVATGVGAVAAGMMIAALALTATMVVSSETNNFMMKIFGDSKDAQIGAMAFWTGLSIVLSLGAAGAASGTANAASTASKVAANAATSGAATGASTGASVTATATNTASTAAATTSKMTEMMNKLKKIAQAIQGAATMGDGSSQAASSTYTYQAENLKADALEEKAFMLRIQQQIDDAMEGIQRAIDELQAGYSVAANIIKANHDTKSTLARNVKA